MSAPSEELLAAQPLEVHLSPSVPGRRSCWGLGAMVVFGLTRGALGSPPVPEAAPTLHTPHAAGTAGCAAAHSTRTAEKFLSADSSVYLEPWKKVS